ncbi:MAG: hypothetical protein ACP5IH_08710, partial [Desulfurella sp.]|uniref:hypothetical protein n=1 Tax=Desulfurella sp. TaxID=1962857 RepID=UPI003D12B99E
TNGNYPDLSNLGSMTGPGSFDATGQKVTTGTGGIFNVSTGNSISISENTACTNGYTVTGSNANINASDIGGSKNPVSYDSCTGQYTGF